MVTAQRAQASLDRAQHFIGLVRDYDPADSATYLQTLTPEQLWDLPFVLAALVPVDQTPAELLEWCDPERRRRERDLAEQVARQARITPLRPHGTHAAYVRHKNRDEQPCDSCVLAERVYQRNRKRASRAS
jgi:hypothetical protein